MENLQVSFNNSQDNTTVLSVNLEGKLIDMNAYDFKSDLLNMLRENNQNCVIDIRELLDIDIVGINALAVVHRELLSSGLTLTILSKSQSSIERLFSLTKFDTILNIQRA